MLFSKGIGMVVEIEHVEVLREDLYQDYIIISEQISKKCVVTFSLCPGRSPKVRGGGCQTAPHRAPRGPSFVTTGESWVWDSLRGG